MTHDGSAGPGLAEVLKRAIARAQEGCEGETDECCCAKGSNVAVERWCDPGLISACLHSALRAATAPQDGQEARTKPRVLCLCGSTRFIDQFATATWELERQGFIALGCTLLPMWFCGVPSHFGEATGTKEQCDQHHRRKIDLADDVLVLDIGGYIGESTRGEIAYAEALGKPVHYVSEDADMLARILPAAPQVATHD